MGQTNEFAASLLIARQAANVPSLQSYKEQNVAEKPQQDILNAVYKVIQDRKQNPSEKSYVASLYAKGLDKILGKVGEEATEVAIAGKGGRREEVICEVADLWFHTLILLSYYDLPPERIYEELQRRFGTSGLEEKAARTS